jgi:cell division protein FtsL
LTYLFNINIEILNLVSIYFLSFNNIEKIETKNEVHLLNNKINELQRVVKKLEIEVHNLYNYLE